MSDFTPAHVRTSLADAVSIWRIHQDEAKQVIDAAVDCLLADVDSPTLRELAGTQSDESRFVLAPLIEDTLHELGMSDVLTVDAQRGALNVMLRRLVNGQISARELAKRAHRNVGHDGPAECQVFVDLDDMYDTADYSDFTSEELDRWTVEEADAFLAGRPSPGRTHVWRNPP